MSSTEFIQIGLFGSDVRPLLFPAAKIENYEVTLLFYFTLYDHHVDILDRHFAL